MFRLIRSCCIVLICLAISTPILACFAAVPVAAAPTSPQLGEEERLEQLKLLFDAYSAVSGIPWYWFAAINQYERTMNNVNKGRKPINDQLINIYYSDASWAGRLNPDPEDDKPLSIQYFGGIGTDGNGDGKADRTDPMDALNTMMVHIQQYGITDDKIKTALWEYYHNPRSVQRIEQFARMFATFGTLDLTKKAFPVPTRSHYSYRSTWGQHAAGADAEFMKERIFLQTTVHLCAPLAMASSKSWAGTNSADGESAYVISTMCIIISLICQGSIRNFKKEISSSQGKRSAGSAVPDTASRVHKESFPLICTTGCTATTACQNGHSIHTLTLENGNVKRKERKSNLPMILQQFVLSWRSLRGQVRTR